MMVIAGCKGTSEDTVVEPDVQQESTQQEAVISKTSVGNKLPCKSSSPPILDKSKLKEMLMANGKITPDMSDEMANRVVREYIKKKRDAYKRCKK
jgi:hypothetical protein